MILSITVILVGLFLVIFGMSTIIWETIAEQMKSHKVE